MVESYDQIPVKWKREAFSAITTFFTAFLLTIAPMIETLSMEAFTGSAIVGVLAAGARAGVKALMNYLARRVA